MPEILLGDIPPSDYARVVAKTKRAASPIPSNSKWTGLLGAGHHIGGSSMAGRPACPGLSREGLVSERAVVSNSSRIVLTLILAAIQAAPVMSFIIFSHRQGREV